ncbi:hypothetical protein CYLTODRAFT_360463 [Cylindrobasidium torrendii FP15055 ss-10]|uniref:Amino acid transporter transmembrane domain-containing protein n=1 Tax=Cylindrobasidium torrendii FP15055 ss-10 TaxID=1314674 RepID=A0A0D7AXL8_9AGAR|nr:hypothetical protein CYLTODRAFT_360463 [Cylindrobasidium torrendii FP15055 ss-10]
MSPSPRTSISSSARSSPVLTALDSSSHLILVHDDNSDTGSPLDFSLDDPDDDEQVFDASGNGAAPLSPPLVLLYLLAPLLKLGAVLLPHTRLPLKIGLPAFFLFAVLAAFTRRILYMLSRYLRKGELEDVVLEVFAKGRGKEKTRAFLRTIVRGGTGALRIIVSAMYLRNAVEILAPLFPSELSFPPDILLTAILAIVLFPLSLGKSLGSLRTQYCTGASVITYILWLILACVAHAKGTLRSYKPMGTLWSGITTIAFAFAAPSTLSLYSSLKAGMPAAISTAKPSKAHSFMILSIASVLVAVVLTVPLMIFSAFPTTPRIQGTSYPLEPYIATFAAASLVLFIPPMMVMTPNLPIPERVRQSTTIPLSRLGLYIPIVVISLLPPVAFGVFSDIALTSALLGTFILPALLHITAHYVKRPLSIVMNTPHPNTGLDELLQRKERSLQRAQLKKRIIWDLGVWFLLLPLGGGGMAWVVGRLSGQW